jgi:hypothetical protein
VKGVRSVFRVSLVLWIGSLWGLIWVTSVLFRSQPDRALAGMLAGHLFSIETYLAVAVALLALLLPGRTKFLWGYLAAVVLALNEWLLRPVMAEARLHGTNLGLSFGAWHGVSAGLYGIACLATLLLVWNEDFR